MFQSFFPLPLITGVSAGTQNIITVASTSAAAANTNAIKWIVTYS